MTPADTGNPYLDSILWGDWKWETGPVAYFFDDDYRSWTAVEKSAYRGALKAWSTVADLDFVEVQTEAEADLVAHTLNHGQMVAAFGGSPDPYLHGRHDSPQQVDENGKAHGYFNAQAYGGPAAGTTWHPDGLKPGGFGFYTYLQQLGLALGLAHPHDTSDGWSTLMPNVSLYGFDDTGYDRWGLGGANQGMYTVMSYNRGWERKDPQEAGLSDTGHGASPGAFDIAAIQHLYGANPTAKSGNDVYRLYDQMGYVTIWDTGGRDKMVYFGDKDVRIALSPVPISQYVWDYTTSHVKGADTYGGFLLPRDTTDAIPDAAGILPDAAGVLIENVTTGSGDDVIATGSARNVIRTNAGNDGVDAGFGRDRVYGGKGHDGLNGGQDNDRIYGEGGNDGLGGHYGNDLLFGGAGRDFLSGGQGDDTLFGGPGNDTMNGNTGYDTFVFRLGYDVDKVLFYSAGVDTLRLDPALWAGVAGIETAQDVVDAFAFYNAGGHLVFRFNDEDRLMLIDARDNVLDRVAGDIEFI